MKFNQIKYLLLALLAVVIIPLSSCTEPEIEPDQGNLEIRLHHYADSNLVKPNELIHKNLAGYSYSVTRLEYYLSNFTLVGTKDGSHKVEHAQYISFDDSSTSDFTLQKIPFGDYSEIVFNFGLHPLQNISYSLPNTPENIGMAWPESMGGGYHFMKFEGKYLFQAKKIGYAIHLGTDICTLQISIPINVTIDDNNTAIDIAMDLNQWMENPNTYDFERDGSYTMGDTITMTLVRDNGHTVFKLHKN